jgi:phosphoribosylamine---glycine ligase
VSLSNRQVRLTERDWGLKMKLDQISTVLLVDRSGRGHAICDLFVRTNDKVTVYFGPGNNLVEHSRIKHAPSVRIDCVDSILEFCQRTPVDLIFITCMDSLTPGFVDILRGRGHNVIGATKAGAALESSKKRGKEFCQAHGIVTPKYRVCTSPREARDYIDLVEHDVVVKEDGVLQCSDGVHVCFSKKEALAAVDYIANKDGEFIVTIEERIAGTEVSITAFTDGKNCHLLPLSLDYKRVFEGDSGKNCDGMGTIAPHPLSSPDLYRTIEKDVIGPFLKGLAVDGLDFSGFVYFGGMITSKGLQILEINARLGDSEAQAILPAIQQDFSTWCLNALHRELPAGRTEGDGLYRCCVIATQGCVTPSRSDDVPGWPFGNCEFGQAVTGIQSIDLNKALVFFDGIEKDPEGRPRTSRGRVINIVGYGEAPEISVANAYSEVEKISFAGVRYRKDIGIPDFCNLTHSSDSPTGTRRIGVG